MNLTNPAPLTSDNAAVVFVDNQVGLMTGIRDYSIADLKHNIVGLAKAAKALGLPIVTTTTSSETLWGPAIPELQEALPDQTFIDRTTVNAWDDPRVEEAIRATGRSKLIFAGLSLEVCAAFPAMRAVREGFEAYIAVDASGTFNMTKRETALHRLTQAGVVIADGASLMIEILADNANEQAGAPFDWEDPAPGPRLSGVSKGLCHLFPRSRLPRRGREAGGLHQGRE
jgi:nicotinamidase-related amidase